MLAENAALNGRRKSSGNDDAGEHRLIQIAHDLFDREGHSGNRRVKGRSDPGSSADRQQASQIVFRERGGPNQKARNPGANLNRRAFTSERSAGADLQCADEKLTDGRVKQGEFTAPDGVGYFGLWDAAAACARDDI